MHFNICPICGATWDPNGQLYWSGTGKPGKDEDLNALVCKNLPTEKSKNCVNPCKGSEGGIGWEERMKRADEALLKFDL
jgi:hypothetical protein